MDVATPETKPEWIRPSDTRRHFGISRSMAYEWIKDGLIVSKVVRKRGNLTGIRLISYDSINNHINSLPNE